MDLRTMLPLGAAAAFAIFLLWKMRPAGIGRRPIDPRIAQARARAAEAKGAARAAALCEAGQLSIDAQRPTAAFGYYLRATRADETSVEAVTGIARALGRNRRTLERVLFRILGSIDWDGPARPAARAAAAELVALHRRGNERWRVEALEKLLATLSRPQAPAEPERRPPS